MKRLKVQVKSLQAEKETTHIQSANFGAEKMYEMLVLSVDEWWGEGKAVDTQGNPYREKFLELLETLEEKIIERYEKKKEAAPIEVTTVTNDEGSNDNKEEGNEV